jgi:hypothetical protein
MTIQKGKPEQLKLLMSAREIMGSHVPNEPDRNWHGTRFSVAEAMGGAWVREQTARYGEVTKRTSRTDGGINFENPNGPGYLRGPKRTKATRETDEQLYSRKLSEAKHRDPVTMGHGVPTLFGSIRKEGVKTPIALGRDESRPDFVAGGHHRLAVMAHLNPDQLLPVIHVNSVTEAKKSGY